VIIIIVWFKKTLSHSQVGVHVKTRKCDDGLWIVMKHQLMNGRR